MAYDGLRNGEHGNSATFSSFAPPPTWVLEVAGGPERGAADAASAAPKVAVVSGAGGAGSL